jgi:archaellum biogenesis ATPase FlaH
MSFREEIFLKALTKRPEDTKVMSRLFRPEWLEQAEYQPILQKIYEFSQQYGTPPTFSVLHTLFEIEDKSLYEGRFKDTLNNIDNAPTELADMLLVIDMARDVAISRSFIDMVNSPVFTEMNEANDGKGQMQEVEKWSRNFKDSHEDLDLDIKDAIEKLVAERGHFQQKTAPIPCGIKIIDEWSGGGIRPKNLAIILAPTGHGKSVFLASVAHYIAKHGDHRVLFITNELSMEETTERFLSKISGQHLSKIIEDPTVGYNGIERHWASISGKLRILEMNREADCDEIEALVLKFTHAYGWRPDVVVIDFMERMKPTVTGVKRDQSWNWLGYIAKDLVRMAKRNNWLVWTAGQTNRRGMNEMEEQSLSHAQGSVQHLQEAALVVSMRQINQFSLEDNEDNEKTLLQFKPLKMRHSKKPGSAVMVEATLGHLEISDVVRTSGEFKEDIPESDKAGAFPDGRKGKDVSTSVENDSDSS